MKYENGIKSRVKKDREKANEQNIEKYMIFAFAVIFVLLIAAQTALTSPSVASLLNINTEYEGEPLGKEVYLYKQGEIELGLAGGRTNGSLILMLNGENVATFDKGSVRIEVKNGDVIEIDGSNVEREETVKVLSCSSNLDKKLIVKSIKVKSEIKYFLKISLQ